MPMGAIAEHGELCESLLRGPKPGEFGTLATWNSNKHGNRLVWVVNTDQTDCSPNGPGWGEG